MIIMTAEIGNSAQGVNYGDHIRIAPAVVTPNHRRHRAVLTHEIMHYWFRGNASLIDEGLAELASAVHIAAPGKEPRNPAVGRASTGAAKRVCWPCTGPPAPTPSPKPPGGSTTSR